MIWNMSKAECTNNIAEWVDNQLREYTCSLMDIKQLVLIYFN